MYTYIEFPKHKNEGLEGSKFTSRFQIETSYAILLFFKSYSENYESIIIPKIHQFSRFCNIAKRKLKVTFHYYYFNYSKQVFLKYTFFISFYVVYSLT